eukprot:7391993-Prymnesium_polylepis.1
MPNGLVFVPSDFGIHTRRTGFASYLFIIVPSTFMASYFCSSVFQISPSMPGVWFLLFLAYDKKAHAFLATKSRLATPLIDRVSFHDASM